MSKRPPFVKVAEVGEVPEGAGNKAVKWMIASLVVLFVAISIFGYSSTLQQTGP